MANTGLFDSHAHLDDEQFDEDRNAVIERINDNLAGIINPGCDAKSSAFAVKLAEENEKIYAAVGYHPSDLAKIKNANYLDELAAWAAHDKVVAIGEIGLDYYWQDNEPKEVQQKRLLEQIDLAKQFDLPVIIHDRDAHGDILNIFQKKISNVRAVFHCYSGSLEMAKELLKKDFYLSFGGTSTYKNAAKVREVLLMIPEDRLLFETDSPYLAPVPQRGKRNEPSFVELVARNAAILRGTQFELLAEQTTKNAKALFTKIK